MTGAIHKSTDCQNVMAAKLWTLWVAPPHASQNPSSRGLAGGGAQLTRLMSTVLGDTKPPQESCRITLRLLSTWPVRASLDLDQVPNLVEY